MSIEVSGPCIIVEGYIPKTATWIGRTFPFEQQAAANQLYKSIPGDKRMAYVQEGRRSDYTPTRTLSPERYNQMLQNWAGDWQGDLG